MNAGAPVAPTAGSQSPCQSDDAVMGQYPSTNIHIAHVDTLLGVCDLVLGQQADVLLDLIHRKLRR